MNLCNGKNMSKDLLTNGNGISTQYINGQWRIDANTGAVIIEDIVLPSGETVVYEGSTVQDVLNNLYKEVLPKIPLIDNATMFKTIDGVDPEFTDVTDLNPGGVYVRFTFKNVEDPLYVSCWLLQSEIERLDSLVENGISREEFFELQMLVEEKAPAEQLRLLQEEVANKVDSSQLSTIQAQIDTKANADKVASLESLIANKADKLNITGLQQQLDQLTTKIDQLADSNLVQDIKSDIQEIEATIATLASQEAVITLQSQVEDKATKDEVKALADKFDSMEVVSLDELTKQVSTLDKKTNNLSINVDGLDTKVKKKADLTYVEQIDNDLKKKLTAIEKDIANKASSDKLDETINDVNATVVSMNNSIKTLENSIKSTYSTTEYVNDKFNSVLHRVNENYTTYKNEVATINKRLINLEKSDVEFKSSIREIKKSAERQWIEIMTPEQYRRLPSSSIEANKIYMCIKYNKPYAMYVGSVLIAQRDSKSSNGFAYTFPLTF